MLKKSIRKTSFTHAILPVILTSFMAINLTGCPSNKDTQKPAETQLAEAFEKSAETKTEPQKKAEIKKTILTPAKSIDEVPNRCPSDILQVSREYKSGQIRHDTYFSTTCNRNRGFNIFLPASYNNEQEYPVLYFLHGIFGNEYSLTGDQGLRIRELLSNMGGSGLSEEMIVVFPNMYASSDPNVKPGFDEASVAPYDNFINDLTTDLMPFIENKYRVKTGRENTAIGGFSMGGREGLYISIKRSDLFNYVGAIAPAPGVVPARDWAMEHKGQMTEEEFKYSAPLPKLVMICCGTNDGTVGHFPLEYHKLFEKNGVEHYWYEITGANHDNTAIQSGLYHFLQFVFR